MSDAIQLSSATSAGPYIAVDNIGSTMHPLTKLEFGSSGTATLVSTTNPLPVVSTAAQALSTTGMGGSSANPIHVITDTNTVILAQISGQSTALISTASIIQTEPKAGATFPVSFSTGSTASVIVSNSTLAPVPVLLQGSTATVTVQGSVTATVSTASAIQVEPKAGASFAVTLSSGSTVSAQITGGQSTALISTASAIQVEPKAGASFGVTFSTASTVSVLTSTASVIRVGNDTAQLIPIKIENAFGSTTAIAISGTSTAIISTASIIRIDTLTTASNITTYQPTSTNLNGTMRLWAGPTESTWNSTKLTSTATVTLFSSAASTRFNIVDVLAVNSGASETVLTIYDGTTGGTKLVMAALSTAGGGFSQHFAIPRAGSSGAAIVAEIVPASTVYLNIGAFKSA